jgi:chemotaxis protein MotB
MITFADLLSLLLAFFVLMFTMSSINNGAWKAVADSLAQRLKTGEPRTAPRDLADANFPRASQDTAVDLDYLRAVLRQKGADVPLLRRASLTRGSDRLVIALPADLLFEVGAARLTEPAAAAIAVLGDVFRGVDNRLEVEGHTDPVPVTGNGPYASNWELSLARAVVVANTLRTAGYGADITAYGLADSRYYEALPEGADAADRDALSRRVDLIVRDQPARGDTP